MSFYLRASAENITRSAWLPRFAYRVNTSVCPTRIPEGICRYAPAMYSATQMQSVTPAVREEASLSEGGFLVCLAQ